MKKIFFDEDEEWLIEHYKVLGIVTLISITVSILAIIGG